MSALPPVLLSALRAAELDDPRVLGEYPVDSLHDLEEYVGGKIEIGGALSGAGFVGSFASFFITLDFVAARSIRFCVFLGCGWC